MPDDHSDVVPLLPIPNRTVKRVCANDSAGSRVKVGHRQALIARNAPIEGPGRFLFPSLKELKTKRKSVLEYKAPLIAVRQAAGRNRKAPNC